MKGTLHKTEQGWVVRYKVPAYTKANEQTFFDRELILHPDEPHIVDSRWDGKDVEFEEVEFVHKQRGDNVWVKYGAKNINQLPQQDVEKEMFELEQQLDVPSNMRWHNKELPQQEISNEEIDKAADNYANKWIDGREAFYGFIEGAKWYREQLKSK